MSVGPCYYCGHIGPLNITYYNYPIVCNCCDGNHKIRIEHCNNCKTEQPIQTKIWISTEKLLDPVGENLFVKIS